MKQYQLKLFKNEDKKHLQQQMHLAYWLAIYNQTGGDIEDQDVVNYIHNKCPYMFVIYNFGGYGKKYDIQYRDQSLRCGTIELIEDNKVFKSSVLLEAINAITGVYGSELIVNNKEASEELSQFIMDSGGNGSITGPFITGQHDAQLYYIQK